jgi:lipoyl(octanoyl) transferase
MTIPAHLRIDHRIAYGASLDIQASAARERAANARPDSLWLLEHDPVFTAGRTTRNSAWPPGEKSTDISGIPVVRTERGGSLTYHGPGQVVGYPILRLKTYCPGPKLYVRMLEEVILRTLHQWEIVGHRLDGFPGVWIGTDPIEKVASIGLRVSQGITTHGFALNADMDLAPFSLIVPCGIPGCRVTSMARYLGHPIDVGAVKSALAAAFADVFQIDWAMDRPLTPQPPGKLTMVSRVETLEP